MQMFSDDPQENVFFYWDGNISDTRLRILRDCVYSTRVFNPTKQIFIISNTITNDMIDDAYNISCVKWDISFFDGLNINKEKINQYMCSHPRTFSDLFRIVLLYKFGGSYIDTDDLAIRKLPMAKNLICRSYDPHTCFYNNIADSDCIQGKYREIRGYDDINIFPRNDCWLNWDKEHYFLLGLLHDDKFVNCDDVIDILGKWSWQSLTLEHCKKNINTIGIDWILGLTLLYLYEDFISHSSSWDMGKHGGEMVDVWNNIAHKKTEEWGNWKVTKEEAMKFYNIISGKYPYLSHLWLHSKDGKQEWITEEDIEENTLYSVSTWILKDVREKIKLYKSSHTKSSHIRCEMFDAVVFINLKHRPDRKEFIMNEIQKIKNIDESQIYRIDAVLEPMCGHIGCGKSHIKALELAIANDWSSVLILEDDFCFNEHYEGDHSFNKIQNIEWDVMLLAQGYHYNQDSEYDFLKIARRATTASGYIVKRHYYPILLDNFKNSVIIMEQEFQTHSANCMAQGAPISKLNICSAIDQHWFSLQEKDTFYMFHPPIGHQRNSWSDNNCSCEYQENQIKILKKN